MFSQRKKCQALFELLLSHTPLRKGNPYDVQEAEISRGSAARITLTIKCPLKQACYEVTFVKR
jgi:hypothetical protein